MESSAFPRGGQLSLNPLEYREIVEQATQDAMTQSALTSTASQSKRPKHKSNNDANKKQKTDSIHVKEPSIESLTFKVIY